MFNTDPAAQAREFVKQGAQWLHIVDLDGAVAGKAVNDAAVRAILGAVKVPVQLGGGVRDRDAIARWLGAGMARVILGTAALNDPDLVNAACREFPRRVAVGIDARRGKVAVRGWVETSDMTALDLARHSRMRASPQSSSTDIDRDGDDAGRQRRGDRPRWRRPFLIPVIRLGRRVVAGRYPRAERSPVIRRSDPWPRALSAKFALADCARDCHA